jgi:crossover junction endodeoxyribonuclease RusA
MRLLLPWPPSVNHYYRHARGKVLISEAGKHYRKAVADYVMVHRLAALLPDRLAVFVRLHAPTRQKYDIDNRLKALLDAMEKAGVYQNDEQIDRITVVRRDRSPPHGRVEVEIVAL